MLVVVEMNVQHLPPVQFRDATWGMILYRRTVLPRLTDTMRETGAAMHMNMRLYCVWIRYWQCRSVPCPGEKWVACSWRTGRIITR